MITFPALNVRPRSQTFLLCIPLLILSVQRQPAAPRQMPLIIDAKGVEMNRCHVDLADCEAYAQQVPVGDKAVVKGATGAVAGAAVEAVKGASQGLRDWDKVVKRYMRGRGCRVRS